MTTYQPQVRRRATQHMRLHAAEYEPFLGDAAGWTRYIADMEQAGNWGDELTLVRSDHTVKSITRVPQQARNDVGCIGPTCVGDRVPDMNSCVQFHSCQGWSLGSRHDTPGPSEAAPVTSTIRRLTDKVWFLLGVHLDPL